MKTLLEIALCVLALGAGCAEAQTHSVSYSTWAVSGNMITLRYLLPVAEAQRLMGVGVPVLTTGKLEDYLLEHLTVQSAGGECPAIDQGFDLGRVDPLAVGPDLYGFEIFYRCADPRHLILRDTALFARAPAHVDFAVVQIRDQSSVQLFTAQQQELSLPDDRAPTAAGLGLYVHLGFQHMIKTPDRWCFLLGALLFLRRRRHAGYLLLALIGGYALALAVSAAGWILPREPLLEAFMGLLVALLGAAITQREMPRLPLTRVSWPAVFLLGVILVALLRAPWAMVGLLGGAVISVAFLMLSRAAQSRSVFWPGLVATFAFLDGFVLPAVLPPAQLPRWTQVRMFLGFDLGSVIFDALLVGMLLASVYLFRTTRFVAPRSLLNDVSAACLSGLGTFWLLSRLG